MPSAIAATPSGWTLRFKHHKNTTLLHADPLQSLSSLKVDLLNALRVTHPDGRLSSGLALPTDPIDIIFGKAKDMHDLSIGWERVSTVDEAAQEPTRKKKANPEDSPKGIGLKDGGVLAYKFKSEDMDLDEGLGLEDDDEKWNVVIPVYEEPEDGPQRLPVYAE